MVTGQRSSLERMRLEIVAQLDRERREKVKEFLEREQANIDARQAKVNKALRGVSEIKSDEEIDGMTQAQLVRYIRKLEGHNNVLFDLRRTGGDDMRKVMNAFAMSLTFAAGRLSRRIMKARSTEVI